MKLDADDILERKDIIGGFCIPLQHTPLYATDITDHKCQVEKVYRGMLHEACVIDDCCLRFERMFKWDWN